MEPNKVKAICETCKMLTESKGFGGVQVCHKKDCKMFVSNVGIARVAPEPERFQRSINAWTIRLSGSSELGMIVALLLASPDETKSKGVILRAKWDSSAPNGSQLSLEKTARAFDVRVWAMAPICRERPEHLAALKGLRKKADSCALSGHVGVICILHFVFVGVNEPPRKPAKELVVYFASRVPLDRWDCKETRDPTRINEAAEVPLLLELMNGLYGKDLYE